VSSSDGRWRTIAANTDAQFVSLLAVLQVPELADDRRFATNVDRIAHRSELVALLEPEVRALRRDKLMADLHRVGVPAGPIYAMSEVYDDPHVIARGIRGDALDQQGRSVPIVRSPIRLGSGIAGPAVAPELGQHTRQVLHELLQLDEATLDELATDDVIA
jgi:crotonobetainyl-CoA:carnitine CoA-transferase CaiB-like acyl-CoA transferase